MAEYPWNQPEQENEHSSVTGGPVYDDTANQPEEQESHPVQAPPFGGYDATHGWPDPPPRVEPEPQVKEPQEDFEDEYSPFDDVKPKKKKRKRRGSDDDEPERAEMSSKEKKLAKRTKKAANAEQSAKRSVSMVKALVFVLFAVLVGIKCIGRIETANALVGSTTLPTSITQTMEDDTSDDAENPDDTVGEPPDVSDDTLDAPVEYVYIEPAKLDGKSATDLAVWYLREFPEGKTVNNDALKEFQVWYDDKVAEDAGFDSKFNEALSYVKAHPEFINPVKETPKKDDTAADTSTPDNAQPSTPTNTTPNTSTTTPSTQPSGNTTNGSGE